MAFRLVAPTEPNYVHTRKSKVSRIAIISIPNNVVCFTKLKQATFSINTVASVSNLPEFNFNQFGDI